MKELRIISDIVEYAKMLANATNIRQAKSGMTLEPLIKKVVSNEYARNYSTAMP